MLLKTMKKPLIFILICAFVSMGLHLYLSHRAESLAAGTISDHSPLCHINEQFNCDNTLVSPYSHFAGTHLSNWGFATHFLIFILAFALWTGWSEHKKNLLVSLWGFSFLSAIASIIMLGISIFILQAFCVLCGILYTLSFLIIFFLFFTIKDIRMSLSSGFKTIQWTPLLGFIALWGMSTFLSHITLIKFKDTKASARVIEAHFQDWLDAPSQEFKTRALLSAGPQKPNIIITEFADFLCHHCRNVHHTLKIFKASHPGVQINYYSFPLDQCKGKTASCLLTRAVHCSEKHKQGWNLLDAIYKNQKDFSVISKEEEQLQKLKQIASSLQINWSDLSLCVNSPSAFAIQEQQVQTGQEMNIHGTPTLFVNGRKLHHRYALKMLQTIHSHISRNNETHPPQP